jgi:hypothetical protein
MTLLIIITIGIVIWSLYGYLSVRNIEKPNYTVITPSKDEFIAKNSNIELRKYTSMIVAETVVDGPYDTAINTGFRNIANYIFGNNTASNSIAMTSPVLQKPSSQTIAMTTPVLQKENKNTTYTISFVMPAKYTMQTIPKPNSTNVQLREITDSTIAAITFSGFWTNAKAERFTNVLTTALRQDGYTFNATPQYARYNPPWTPPWMRRNETWIEIN